MIIPRDAIEAWIKANVDYGEHTDLVPIITKEWYDLGQRSKPQIVLNMAAESPDVADQLDYPNGGFRFVEIWNIHLFSSNINFRNWMLEGFMKALRTKDTYEIAEDDDGVLYDMVLDGSPRILNKSERRSHEIEGSQSNYLWENYRAIIPVKIFNKYY